MLLIAGACLHASDVTFRKIHERAVVYNLLIISLELLSQVPC